MSKKLFAFLALAVAGAVVALGQSPDAKVSPSSNEKNPLIGAWHLAWLDEPGADGKINHITDAKGSLIYTPDGRMSVQIMFAKAEPVQSDSPVQYAQGGYEGSFGRYDVDEKTHTVTHHVEGANVRSLVGKHLPRVYAFSDGRLTIKSARPDEHWSVGWERY